MYILFGSIWCSRILLFRRCHFGGNSYKFMVESNVQSIADLVDYVHTMLNQRFTFKKVVEALNIKDPRQFKRLLTKALHYKFKVYGSFSVEELSYRIQAILSIDEHFIH